MRKKFIILFVFALTQVCADHPEVNEAYAMFEKADQRQDEFSSELEWYLSQHCSDDKADSDDDVTNGFIEKWNKEKQEERVAIAEVQKAFVEFRNKLCNVLRSHATGNYALTLDAGAALDITNWYTNYLERHLFGYKWKNQYEKYLKSKNVPPTTSPQQNKDKRCSETHP